MKWLIIILNTYGTKSVISPTMKKMGFNVMTLWDIDEDKKPLEIIKSNDKLMKKNYIIYHVFIYRDKSGKGIQIFWK